METPCGEWTNGREVSVPASLVQTLPVSPHNLMLLLGGPQTQTSKADIKTRQRTGGNNNKAKSGKQHEKRAWNTGGGSLFDDRGVWGIWNKTSGTFLVYRHEDGFQCPIPGKCEHHSGAGRGMYHL